MTSFRKGDVYVEIKGRRYILRLTLGALAEIDERLGVKGPLELAKKLKGFSADEGRVETALHLLECLLRPAFPAPVSVGGVDIPALVKAADFKSFMPAITHLFEMSFKELNHG